MKKIILGFVLVLSGLPALAQKVAVSSTVVVKNPSQVSFWLGRYRDSQGTYYDNYGVAKAGIFDTNGKLLRELDLTDVSSEAGVVISACNAAAEAARARNKKVAIDYHYVGTPWICSVASEDTD